MKFRIVILPVIGSLVLACSSNGSNPKTDAQWKQEIVTGMHDALLAGMKDLQKAAVELQSAAPIGRGWNAQQDAEAIRLMKATWVRARAAYEHIEGAVAPLFPEID